MTDDIPGIHHVTAIASDAERNLRFYTDTLGLRLVKRSVNQDDPTAYHLFYADRVGSPGTSMTFFAWPEMRDGRVGTGQVGTTGFRVPAGSLDYWRDRFESEGVDHDAVVERFDERVLSFRDPDGIRLELVAADETPDGDPWPESPVPTDHAIRGFHGVRLVLADGDETTDLLEELGFEPVAEADGHARYRSTASLGGVVDVTADRTIPGGTVGVGTVHHVAFDVGSEANQRAWRDRLLDLGFDPTPVIDRKYFKSIYVRERGGVLFEFATKEPGYDVDEPVEELGSTLSLPERLEGDREEIEANLPDVDFPVG